MVFCLPIQIETLFYRQPIYILCICITDIRTFLLARINSNLGKLWHFAEYSAGEIDKNETTQFV